MGRDPAVLFYTSDFLTGTAYFDMSERGRYITLLCEQHQNGHIPQFRFDDVCGTERPLLRAKFKKDDNGFWYNERMEIETLKRKAFCQSRRDSINKRYVRSTHVDTHVVHTKVRMENENDNGISTSLDVPLSFNSFWAIYPKKVGKGAAEKAWSKIKAPSETIALITTALSWQVKSEQWTKDGGQFIPMPATYLNQKRWEDEPFSKAKIPAKKIETIPKSEHDKLMAEIKADQEITRKRLRGEI